MQKITKGFRFDHDYRNWLVLDRHVNFVLLEGRQPMSTTIYFCANVLTDGGTEVCRPNVTNLDPDSPAWSLDKMTSYFESQCELIDKRIAAKALEETRQEGVALTKGLKLARIFEAKKIRKESLEELRDIINADDATLKNILTDKRVIALAGKYNLIDLILTNLKA